MKLPKLYPLWGRDKTRKLFRFHITLFIVGSVATNIYALSLPNTTPFKDLIVITPFIFLVTAPFYYLTIDSEKVEYWFLLFIIETQILAAVFMALTGGFQSVAQFGPYLILLLTLFQLGVRATIVLSFFALLSFVGIALFLNNYNPYEGYLGQFIFYTIAYILIVIVDRSIGKQISYQFEVRDKLFQLNTLKNQFITLTSYYLNTPLVLIKGHLETLENDLQGLTSKDKKVKNHISVINQSAVDLETLIEKLVFISDFINNKFEIKNKKININELIESIIEDFELEAEEKLIQISFYPEEVLGEYDFDKTLLSVAIREVISNAIKFGSLDGEVKIKTYLEEGFLVIEISDTGMGIGEVNLENIFKPFFQTTAYYTEYPPQNFEKVGLGLFITKLVVLSYHGEIELESEKGKGTTFRIKFADKS